MPATPAFLARGLRTRLKQVETTHGNGLDVREERNKQILPRRWESSGEVARLCSSSLTQFLEVALSDKPTTHQQIGTEFGNTKPNTSYY